MANPNGVGSRQSDVERFFAGAREGMAVLADAQRELEAHLARRFSVFQYIDLDENRMSHILAHFLDPRASHGQGDLFLKSLLSHLRSQKEVWSYGTKWSEIRVGREALTTRIDDSKRRIDIEVGLRSRDGDRVGLAIENKPDADDQEGQLAAYAAHLEQKYDGRFLLLYLTRAGDKPSPTSIAENDRQLLEERRQFACASICCWAQGWMAEAEEKAKAAQVRWFMSDFRRTLIERFPLTSPSP